MRNDAHSPFKTLTRTFSLVFVLSIGIAAGCAGTDSGEPLADEDSDSDSENSNSTAENDDRSPSGPIFGNENDDVDTSNDQLVTCETGMDCASDEACTQGGRCVNVTGERDAAAVLQADLDELDEPVGIGTPYRLPDNAILQINDVDGNGIGLNVPIQVILEGSGSLLKVENGVTAIRLDQNADWSMVRDLKIEPQNMGSEHDGIGIDVRAHGARLDNLHINRMGTGVRAYTTVEGDINDEFGNVNTQQWSRLILHHLHNTAIDVAGGDSNGGLMSGLEVLGGIGIRDDSFLGNTYIAPTIEGTQGHSMEFGSDAARNAVVGSYVEHSDPDPTSESRNDLFVGGNAIHRVQGSADRIGMRSAQLHYAHPDGGAQVSIPGHENSPFGFSHSEDSATWYFRYFDHPTHLKWGFAHENTSTTPFTWTAADHPDGPALLELGATVD